MAEALRTVVVRVSGRRDAAAQLGSALNQPRQYMRFESTLDGALRAGFDSLSIDELLSNAGLPIWGRERPATLVLLQVEHGGNSYWVSGDVPSAEREAIEKAAQQRGLPIRWPRIDQQPPAAGAANDTSALLESAAQYGANAALLGRAQRNAGGGYSVQWVLASDEANAQATGSLEDGVHMAADTFARVYAASASTLINLTMDVSGLTNLDAYAQTLNYLEGLTLVRNVALEEVAGDVMRFRLTVRGDAETLKRAIALGDRLASTSPASQGDRLSFHYQQ